MLYYPQKLRVINYYWFQTAIKLRNWEKAVEKPSFPPFSKGSCRDHSKSEMVLIHQQIIALLQQQALQKVPVTPLKTLGYRTAPSPGSQRSRDDGRVLAQYPCCAPPTNLHCPYSLLPAAPVTGAAHRQVKYLPWPTRSVPIKRFWSKYFGKLYPCCVTHTHRTSKRQWWQQWGRTKPAVPALSLKPPILLAHTLLGRARGYFWLSRKSGLLVNGGQSMQEQLSGESAPSAWGGHHQGLGATEPGESAWANLYILLR